MAIQKPGEDWWNNFRFQELKDEDLLTKLKNREKISQKASSRRSWIVTKRRFKKFVIAKRERDNVAVHVSDGWVLPRRNETREAFKRYQERKQIPYLFTMTKNFTKRIKNHEYIRIVFIFVFIYWKNKL